MTRTEAAETVVRECLWGDYDLDAKAIETGLSSGDPAFARLVFGKIADNATYPSRLIRVLFETEQIGLLLAETAGQPRWSDLRHRLIRSNLTGDRELVPERRWK